MEDKSSYSYINQKCMMCLQCSQIKELKDETFGYFINYKPKEQPTHFCSTQSTQSHKNS